MIKKITVRPGKGSWLSLALVIFLSACGGSSLESDDDTPAPLVLVNAGNDRSVNEGSTVTLSGDASGQTEALTYSWSVSPALTITHDDTTTAAASFTAPATAEVLTYTFTLAVTDGDGNQGSDTVEYQITPVNEAPIAAVSVSAPTTTTNGGYPAGGSVVLDASASSDPDATNTTAPIAGYRWSQTTGTNVLNNVSLDGSTLEFITPIADAASTLTFALTVTDQEGAEATATIDVPVLSAAQTIPTVDAGIDHQLFSGESIVLDGVATTTVPAAQPLSYSWLNDSALEPQIQDASALQTFAVAPSVESEQTLTFTLTVTDAFGNQVDDSVSVTVRPFPISVLNDTGVVSQASETAVSAGYQPGYPGQDGQRGADVVNLAGQSEKAGRGLQGFDFTRLDSVGDEVDDTSQPWRCVRDNVTGLVWEVKTDDATLHGARHDYTWYQTENNGGINGVQMSASASCTLTSCDTDSFIAAVNAEGLCNFFDWRLPTHNELLSIVHYGQSASPLVDTDYFPNTASGITAPLWYWTQVPSADGATDNGTQTSWVLDFATGNDNFINKATPARIRLVRGGR